MARDKHLLLIDDEEDFCNLMAQNLKNSGWQVDIAYDGGTALKLYEEYAATLSVVVSDLKMPGLQGEELLPEIRRRAPKLPLLAITGQRDRFSHLRALTTGAYFFLEKPFDVEIFDSYVENAHHIFELHIDIEEARAREEKAAKLFRQYIVSECPQQFIVSRRLNVGGLGLEIASHTADTLKPGGDYVEWFSRGTEEVVFCVGDASGHGEFVCTLMACLSTIVLHRSHHLGRLGVEEMFSIIDEKFLDLKTSGGVESNKYICLFLGAISLLSGRLVYVNAGHTEGFLVRKGGEEQEVTVERLEIDTQAAALVSADQRAMLRKIRPFSEKTVKLEAGDILVLFTDGASDFLGEGHGGVKGGMVRLERAVIDNYRPSAAQTLSNLVSWLEGQVGDKGFDDDATLLVIRVLSSEEARVGEVRDQGKGEVSALMTA